MMRISETKLSSVIFIVVTMALITSWMSLWALIQPGGFKLNFNLKKPGYFVAEFLLFNFLIAAVFLSSLKTSCCDQKVQNGIDMLCHVAETDEGKNGCSDNDQCDGGSNCCEGDDDYVRDDDDDDDEEEEEEEDIDPADLEKRADEFIAKMTQGWMEDRLKEKLNYEFSMTSN